MRLKRNFACSKSRYDTFKIANIKGADQTVRMMLICACGVRNPRRQVCWRIGPIIINFNDLNTPAESSKIAQILS